MDQRAAQDILSGGRRGARASVVRAALLAAAGPYAGGMRLRRWLYRQGLLPRHSAAAPVICVGNLTVGGTGKTPMVAWIVSLLKDAGHSPAVLTRGYRSGGGEGDEPALLRALCEAPVEVGADRAAAAARAVAAGADVLVMDDGFQHLRLRRDLDVVLVDATRPWGFGHCLPRGLLREPPSALRDADCVVITRSDAVAPAALAAVRAQVARLAPRASVHAAVHAPSHVFDEAGRERSADDLAGRRVLAVCGLANPAAFFRTLEGLGGERAGRLALDDHVAYTPDVLGRVHAVWRQSGAECIVTTEKDRTKLPAGVLDAAVWTLSVRMRVTEGQAELRQRILAAARGRPTR